MSLLSLTPAGATCDVWYDAYDRSTITLDNGRITAVADKSGGTAYNLTNSDGTATRHPEYSEADGALVYTEDVDQYLSHSTFDPDYDEVTFFFSYTSTGDGDHLLTVVQDNNSSSGDFGVRLATVGGSTTQGNIKYYIGRTQSSNFNVEGVWTTGLKRVMTFTHKNSTNASRFRLIGHDSTTTTAVTELNKTVVSDETTNLQGSIGQAGLLVGGDVDSGGWPDSVDVNIHEIAIYNKYMTESEAAPIEEYLLNHGPPKAPTQTQPGIGLSLNSRR